MIPAFLRTPALALALVFAATASHAATMITGSGVAATETRPVSGFTALSVSLPGDIALVQGDTESLSITADDNLLPEVETIVESGTLKLRWKKGVNARTKVSMKIALGVKVLESIAIAGSGDVKTGSLKVPGTLKISISGSGDVVIADLQANVLKASIAGSGDVTVAGKVDAFDASIAGSGDVKAGRLATQAADISIAGSGDVTLWSTQSIKMRVVGSGDVRYYGDPAIDKSVMGSGSIKRLGAAPG